MSKRSKLFGFNLLLILLFLPNSAIAFPGSSENPPSPLVTAMVKFLGLVSTYLFPVGEEVDGRCSLDPWGCTAGKGTGDLHSANDPDDDIGNGWDPWGSPAPPSGNDDGDLGPGFDPWG